jgi:hypothetical protein
MCRVRPSKESDVPKEETLNATPCKPRLAGVLYHSLITLSWLSTGSM